MAEMEQIKASKNLPMTTLVMIISSAVLFTGVVIFILFPQNKKTAVIKDEKRSATIALDRQKRLYPLFLQAKAAATMEFEPQIPLSERIPLDRGKIDTLTDIFTSIGNENRMFLSSNTLDFSSVKTMSDSVAMELVFEGDLFDYRECLISIIALPFFNTVEAIKITTDKTQVKKFFTKILINIEKK